jgi:tetratricopeptide (TPR) repeat protein
VSENAFCVKADLDYSQLTWSMLDPANGTSQSVLEPALPRVPFIAVRFAKARARLSTIAGKIYRHLRRRISTVESPPASYDAIAKLNIADNVASITAAFYERLGLRPEQSPVYRNLASIRAKLAEEVEAHCATPSKSPLEDFELAWCAYEAGRTREALQLFRELVQVDPLAKAGAADPRAREAFVRAAEIVARDAELRGDAGAAEPLYRRILELDDNGIVARRLLLALWRQGRIQEAADLAPRVVRSDSNLAQHLQGSAAVGDLTRRLTLEVRREPTTERGQHARNFGLQAR